MENKALAGRFRWLLSELCENAGIDADGFIDDQLTYWENKKSIKRQLKNIGNHARKRDIEFLLDGSQSFPSPRHACL